MDTNNSLQSQQAMEEAMRVAETERRYRRHLFEQRHPLLAHPLAQIAAAGFIMAAAGYAVFYFAPLLSKACS